MHVRTSNDIRSAGELRNAVSYVIMDAPDWRIIPAENLVAAFQVSMSRPTLSAHGASWVLRLCLGQCRQHAKYFSLTF